MDERLAANRSNWDERVPVHRASRFYDVDGWVRDGRGPRAHEATLLGDVTDHDLVHLQCHFGLDTLSWARAGARVTGLDFSPAAITTARALAADAGLADRARFVEADVLDAAAALAPATFHIVYVSVGALCWLPSVDRWASQVAALLRPGGRLFLHEAHPLSWALADDEVVLQHTYFEEPEPYVDDYDGTYTDGDATLGNVRSYEWNHAVGEVVSAVLAQGLRVDRLEEHDWTAWPRFAWLVRDADQHWSVPPGRPRLPLSYTLLASAPDQAG